MPLRPETCRTFHRHLYAGWNETVRLLKRGDDQLAGMVTEYTLFDCRWARVFKTGQPIATQMSSDHRRTLHVPRIEIERVGVSHINALDRFVDRQGRFWQPESTSLLTIKLGQQHVCVECWLTDPPVNSSTLG